MLTVLISLAAAADEPNASPADDALSERVFGIGVGTSFAQTELGIPVLNRFGLRWQIDERWALDPSVALGNSATTNSQDDTPGSSSSFVNASAGVRYYAASKSIVHLVALGSVNVNVNSSTFDEDTTSSFGAGVAGGVGLELTPKPWLGFGVDVSNTVVRVSRTNLADDQSQSSWSTQLAFTPNVGAMVHLYY